MILLTGATGFIGNHLLKGLIEKYGYENVIALTSQPILNAQYILHNNYVFDEDFLEKSELNEIEIILHSGAFTPKSSMDANHVIKSYENINSTLKLLSLRIKGLKRIIFLSTIDVYEHTNFALTEETHTKPPSLYGASKLYCEMMISAWSKVNSVDCFILRIGHVYGPGEHQYKKLIPETMRRIINQEELNIWGDGNDLRSFIYIQDVINAILISLQVDYIEGPVNIVSEEAIPIKDVVQTIIRKSGKSIIPNHIFSKHDPVNFIFNNKKMRDFLYTPKISFDEGINAEWEAFKLLYEK